MEFLGKLVNFVILFGGLAYFLIRPLRSFFEKRSSQINQTLKESEESRKEAEKKLEETQKRLASLEEEIAKIKKDGEAAGLKEKERIRRIAQGEAERIKRLSQQEMELQIKARVQELKEYTAELAAALAQESIKKKLTPRDHFLLIDKSIERVKRLNEKSDSG